MLVFTRWCLRPQRPKPLLQPHTHSLALISCSARRCLAQGATLTSVCYTPLRCQRKSNTCRHWLCCVVPLVWISLKEHDGAMGGCNYSSYRYTHPMSCLWCALQMGKRKYWLQGWLQLIGRKALHFHNFLSHISTLSLWIHANAMWSMFIEGKHWLLLY